MLYLQSSATYYITVIKAIKVSKEVKLFYFNSWTQVVFKDILNSFVSVSDKDQTKQ